MDICRISEHCTITCNDSDRRISWRYGLLMILQWRSLVIHNRFRSQAMSNFHLLLYFYGLDCFGTKMKTQMPPLLEAVRKQDNEMAQQFMKGDTWSTLEHLIGAHSGQEWVEFTLTKQLTTLSNFFPSTLVTEIICRRQLEVEAIGRVIIARSSTTAKLRPAKCVACLVKKFLLLNFIVKTHQGSL